MRSPTAEPFTCATRLLRRGGSCQLGPSSPFRDLGETKIDLSREAVVARLRMASDLPSRLGSCLKKQESSCSAVLNLHIDVYLQCSTFLRQ